jgi:hypothetical protein
MLSMAAVTEASESTEIGLMCAKPKSSQASTNPQILFLGHNSVALIKALIFGLACRRTVFAACMRGVKLY